MKLTKDQKKDNHWNWRKIKTIFGHIGLMITLTVYTAVGALVFQSLEYPAEISRLQSLHRALVEQRGDVIRQLENSKNLPNFTILLKEALTDYENNVAKACRGGLQLPLAKDHEEFSSRWNFLQAAFFASTVLTTIGYGNTVPVTFWGRIFCILFGLIGIPLTLSVIANLGVLLATALSALHSRMKKHFPPQKKTSHKLNTAKQRWIYALGGILFLIIYLSAGAALFMLWEEDWGFLEGFYFCFITMTTIGFGDLVPTKPNYMLICTFYILVGLALTSTIIELVRRQYAQSWRTIQALTGPLAESLKRLGEFSGSGIDVTMLQSDIKKMLTVVSSPKRSQDSAQQKQWEEAMDSVFRDIGITPKKKQTTPVLQIVIYESSV